MKDEEGIVTTPQVEEDLWGGSCEWDDSQGCCGGELGGGLMEGKGGRLRLQGWSSRGRRKCCYLLGRGGRLSFRVT
jgi:hypothetical protein